MLYAYNTANQEVASGGNLTLSTVGVRCGCNAVLRNGSVRINHPGVYKITAGVNALGAGTVGIAIAADGSPINGAEATATATATASADLTAFAAIKVSNVCCAQNVAPVTISVQNAGVDATFSELDVIVERA